MSRRSAKHRAIPATESRPRDVVDLATELANLVGAEVDRLRAPESAKLTPTQRGNQIKRCAAMLRELRRLSGDELTEREILRAPRMREIVAAVTKALEPWPEAMVAVGEALARVGGGSPV